MTPNPSEFVPRSVNEVIDRAATDHADRPALITDDRTITYRELRQASLDLAGGLAASGVLAGDRIAASLPNDIDIVVAFYATARLGAVWVGINRQLAPPEKGHILRDTTPTMMLAEADTLASVTSHLGAIGCRGIEVGGAAWQTIAAGPETEHAPASALAPAAIAFTSGTSGFPKGVIQSQHNLVLPGEVLCATRGHDTSFRRGDFLSLTILNLIVLSTLTAAQAGGAAVLTDRTDAEFLSGWIRRHGVTVFNAVPTVLHGFVGTDAIDPRDLDSLEDVWSGGAGCPEHIRRAFIDRYGKQVHLTYGLTEAPTLVTIDDLGEASPDGTSGRPLPHLDVTIGEVADGASGGEVVVGPVTEGRWAHAWQPFLGYWNRPGVDVPVRNGRLHTGDVGHFHDGRLVIVDRLSSVILRGGANVYPAEVERVLRDIAAVADAVVVGVPDDRLGETVQALVELEPGHAATATELIETCRAELARYKVPAHILVVDAIERNAMGKPDRRAATARLVSTADLEPSREIS